MVRAPVRQQWQLLPFTEFESVTPATSLEDLNFNWRERDLPERLRTKHVHRLHPYLGKFIPQLVEIFLRKYQPKMVCDPFGGSGTTLVEALALGIDSYGADVSEFNCLLSRVKTAKYDFGLLEREVNDILDKVLNADQHRLLEATEVYEPSKYLRDWFAPEALQTLLLYRAHINSYQYKEVLQVILSRAARSSRLTTHFDLDFPKKPQIELYYCYKHSRTCQPTRDAKQFLKRYSLDTLRRINNFVTIRSSSATVQIEQGDSRQLKFPQCDLVITSPPYVGLIDYHEQHRYAYELLKLPEFPEEEIGSASRGNSQRAQEEYISQIEAVFANVRESLTKNAHMVVVVHDRRNLYPTIAEHLGFKVVTAIHRQVDRRTGRRASEFFESIFVWKL